MTFSHCGLVLWLACDEVYKKKMCGVGRSLSWLQATQATVAQLQPRWRLWSLQPWLMSLVHRVTGKVTAVTLV